MPSLKQRMATFQKASAVSDSPTKFKKKVGARAPKPSSPKKLSVGLINKINVVTPDSRTSKLKSKSSSAKPKPNPKPNPKPKPKQIDVRRDAAASVESQTQSTMSEKAKSAVVSPKAKDGAQDWEYLYELALQFDQCKLQDAEETKNPTPSATPSPSKHSPGDKKGIKNALEGLMGGNFTANGNFLTNDFIDKYLIENKKYSSLVFDFGGQSKLFKRFDRKDDERQKIIAKFVATLLGHPRSKEITTLNFSNALLPDEFIQELCQQCLIDTNKGLPCLRVLNLESNLIGQGSGIPELAKCLASPQTWRRLQVLKLENQKHGLIADCEEALGLALLECPSLVVVSLSVRGGLERQQINNSVAANLDNLRLARRKHASKTGTQKARKRNEMEQYFDKIAANDSSVTDVDIVGNIKFLGLNPTERTKTGSAFAENKHVKTIKMVKLQLDDNFCVAFGKSLLGNTTIEKIVLDSNAISGVGMKALFEGLSKNSSVLEFQARHQSKTIASADEQALSGLLDSNTSLTKIGIDLRNQMAKMQIDRKTNTNREFQRKQRVAAKKK